MHNERVKGPYSSEEIKSHFASGHLDQEHFVWGRQQEAWLPINKWMKDFSQLVANQTPMTLQQVWHYALDGVSKGPFSRVELVNEIKNMKNKGEILVWTKGMKGWADLYEFGDLLDEVGLNRREHPRANIDGSVVIKYDEKTIIGVLKTVSVGGFGVNQVGKDLAIGQTVVAEVKSDKLNTTIVAKAIVQYSSDTGLYGFKFVGLNMEAKAHIMEFIRGSKSNMQNAA